MSNHVTEERVRIAQSAAPERPVELRFAPHQRAHEISADQWAVELLTRTQAIQLYRDLGIYLVGTMPCEPLVKPGGRS